MPSAFFQLVLPLSVLRRVDRVVKTKGVTRNAFLVGAITAGLADQARIVEVSTMETGAAAREARSKNVSLVMDRKIKDRLEQRARLARTTQASLARGWVLAALADDRADGRATKHDPSIAVLVPALETSRLTAVDDALRSIGTQLARSGRPVSDAFADDSEREDHARRLALLGTIVAGLFGHPVSLNDDDIALMVKLWGKEDAVLIASVLKVENLLEVLGKVAHDKP